MFVNPATFSVHPRFESGPCALLPSVFLIVFSLPSRRIWTVPKNSMVASFYSLHFHKLQISPQLDDM